MNKMLFLVMFNATQYSKFPNFTFRVFETVQNKVSAEIAFSISSLRVRIIAQKCSLVLLKLSLGIRVGMKELSILTSKCGYLIAVIKQMSSADNFNSFRLTCSLQC